MKSKIIGGVVMGLLMAGLAGTGIAAAQGPDYDPDAYTVASEDIGAADLLASGAPAELNLSSIFEYDPDAYSVSIMESFESESPAQLNLPGIFEYDPDAYTVSIQESGAADMTAAGAPALVNKLPVGTEVWSFDEGLDTWVRTVIGENPQGELQAAPESIELWQPLVES